MTEVQEDELILEQLLIEQADAMILEAQYGEITPRPLSEDFMQKFNTFNEATPEITEKFYEALKPFVSIPIPIIEISEEKSRDFWGTL